MTKEVEVPLFVPLEDLICSCRDLGDAREDIVQGIELGVAIAVPLLLVCPAVQADVEDVLLEVEMVVMSRMEVATSERVPEKPARFSNGVQRGRAEQDSSLAANVVHVGSIMCLALRAEDIDRKNL